MAFGATARALRAAGGRTIQLQEFEAQIWPFLRCFDIAELYQRLYVFAPAHDLLSIRPKPGELPTRERSAALKVLFTVLFAVMPSYMTDGTVVDQCQQAFEYLETKLESYSPDCQAFEMLSIKGVPAVSKSLLEPALQEWQAKFRQHLVLSSAVSPILARS